MTSSNQGRERKRAQFTEGGARKSKTTPILIGVLAALVAVAAYLVFGRSDDKPAATTVTTSGGQSASDIRIPLSEINSGQAKFFDHTLANNQSVRFFVVKSSDGVYRAALDACDTCFHAKKGYRQQGDDMVCNNCGLHFPSADVNDKSGGCNPVGVPRTVEGDYLVIKRSDLEGSGRYF